jgi:hypothetical protein
LAYRNTSSGVISCLPTPKHSLWKTFNISGRERIGLPPFDPDAVLSQISLPSEEERLNTASSADSKALTNPSTLELRRLVNKVSDSAHRKIDVTARKLKNTIKPK